MPSPEQSEREFSSLGSGFVISEDGYIVTNNHVVQNASDIQVTFTNGAIVPSTDNDIDLGTSSVEFKDAFFDGTVTSDAFAGPLTGAVTGDVTGNASGTALTVTQPAQTAITSVGTLTALQVDQINIDGSTITGSTAADLIINVTDGQSVVIEGQNQMSLFLISISSYGNSLKIIVS